MKFYLCQTADGPRYARTQAEAKTLDARFEVVNYDTDQAALVDRFNELLTTPATVMLGDAHTIRINGAPASADDVIAIGRSLDEEDGGYPQPPVKPKKGVEVTSLTDWVRPPPAGSCERCATMSAAARQIEGIMAITNVEHSIGCFDEPYLRRVGAALDERMKELAS